jgi:hypothetical protein
MTNVLVLADIGALALALLYGWLASSIVCAELSKRKGYGEKPGLGTGLLLTLLGIVIWLIVPAKPESLWASKRNRKRAAAASA